MEELFETVAWEIEAKSKPTGDPLWARLCAGGGGLLLVATGMALVALHGSRMMS